MVVHGEDLHGEAGGEGSAGLLDDGVERGALLGVGEVGLGDLLAAPGVH